MQPYTHRVHVGSAILVAAVLLLAAPAARAALTVTAGNLGRGFTITEYAQGFPNGGLPSGVGPIGIAFVPTGSVIVTDASDQTLYSLPSHTDGQVITPANVVNTYSSPPAPFSLVQVKIGSTWHIYASTFADFQEIDPITGVMTVVVSGGGGLGMAPYPDGLTGPHAGHIFVAGNGVSGPAILEIDPVAATATPVASGAMASGDGLSISDDGAHVFLARGDSLVSFSTSTWTEDWAAPSHAGEGYDGCAVGLGTLAGYVYVNANSGNVWEFGTPWGTHAGVDNLLLTGGSRGDFIAVDPNVTSGGFPSLLLTQTDRITRLDPPGGGWFGPPASTTSPITNGSSSVGGDGPFATRLLATAPNPTPGSARVDFVLARESRVRIGVTDVQGRELAVIEDRTLGAGTHQAVWDGRTSQGPAAPGLYFVRMVAGGVTSTRSIALAH